MSSFGSDSAKSRLFEMENKLRDLRAHRKYLESAHDEHVKLYKQLQSAHDTAVRENIARIQEQNKSASQRNREWVEASTRAAHSLSSPVGKHNLAPGHTHMTIAENMLREAKQLFQRQMDAMQPMLINDSNKRLVERLSQLQQEKAATMRRREMLANVLETKHLNECAIESQRQEVLREYVAEQRVLVEAQLRDFELQRASREASQRIQQQILSPDGFLPVSSSSSAAATATKGMAKAAHRYDESLPLRQLPSVAEEPVAGTENDARALNSSRLSQSPRPSEPLYEQFTDQNMPSPAKKTGGADEFSFSTSSAVVSPRLPPKPLPKPSQTQTVSSSIPHQQSQALPQSAPPKPPRVNKSSPPSSPSSIEDVYTSPPRPHDSAMSSSPDLDLSLTRGLTPNQHHSSAVTATEPAIQHGLSQTRSASADEFDHNRRAHTSGRDDSSQDHHNRSSENLSVDSANANTSRQLHQSQSMSVATESSLCQQVQQLSLIDANAACLRLMRSLDVPQQSAEFVCSLFRHENVAGVALAEIPIDERIAIWKCVLHEQDTNAEGDEHMQDSRSFSRSFLGFQDNNKSSATISKTVSKQVSGERLVRALLALLTSKAQILLVPDAFVGTLSEEKFKKEIKKWSQSQVGVTHFWDAIFAYIRSLSRGLVDELGGVQNTDELESLVQEPMRALSLALTSSLRSDEQARIQRKLMSLLTTVSESTLSAHHKPMPVAVPSVSVSVSENKPASTVVSKPFTSMANVTTAAELELNEIEDDSIIERPPAVKDLDIIGTHHVAPKHLDDDLEFDF